MGKSKDKLYLMTYLECQWEDNRSYVRTYERIELEDYIKLALKVKERNSGERCYDRQYIIDRVEELESGCIQDLGTYDETIFSPSLLIKTNSKANAKKLIVAMEKGEIKEEERRRISMEEKGYYNDWD